MKLLFVTVAALLCRTGQAQRRRSSVREGRLLRKCATMPTDKPYHLLSKSSGLALNVVSSADSAHVEQSPVSFTNKLKFEPTSGNYYQLVVQHNDMVIGVEDSSLAKPEIIQLSKTKSNASIEWCFVAISSGVYKIKNRRSGLVLDVGDSSADDGGTILQQKSSDVPTQFWYLGDASVSHTRNLAFVSGGPSKWEGKTDTLVIAAAAANLPDGRILMWSAAKRMNYANGGGKTQTAMYNPLTGVLEDPKTVNTGHDMFCPGTAMQADGILISGGSNAGATTFYSFDNDEWRGLDPMKITRAYHSMTVLKNGSVFTIGGSWKGGTGNKDGERWRYNTNNGKWEWQKLANVKDAPLNTDDKEGAYRADNHYWLFLAPNGNIFHAGPSKRMHWVTTEGLAADWSVKNSLLRGNDGDSMNGNAVMYDVGKILTIGGTPHYDLGTASDSAYIIDINGDEAKVTQTGSMRFRRALHNSVVLPSGEVVVVGGRTQVNNDLFTDNKQILMAEIWNPKTNEFRYLKNMQIPRNYHSVALLTKDGRVFSAGGGLCGDANICKNNHNDFDILTPPYLLNSNGSLKTRPKIVSAPGATKAGRTITVTMNTNQKHTFALVRLGAVTHSVNNDQRRIPLPATQSGSTFRLEVNSNENVALVGNYFLFAMNAAGVPSVAETIRINY